MIAIPNDIPFIKGQDIVGFSALLSNFIYNQSGLPENVMAIASLLVDSANTRSFGIPKYGFSARENISPFGGVCYNCCNFIDVRTVPDENGQTTLVTSVFFRLSLNEDTYFFGSTPPPVLSSTLDENLSLPFIEELMADPEIMARVVRLVNDDLENLSTNMELLRNGKNEEVFLKYYGELLGIDTTEYLQMLQAHREQDQPLSSQEPDQSLSSQEQETTQEHNEELTIN